MILKSIISLEKKSSETIGHQLVRSGTLFLSRILPLRPRLRMRLRLRLRASECLCVGVIQFQESDAKREMRNGLCSESRATIQVSMEQDDKRQQRCHQSALSPVILILVFPPGWFAFPRAVAKEAFRGLEEKEIALKSCCEADVPPGV